MSTYAPNSVQTDPNDEWLILIYLENAEIRDGQLVTLKDTYRLGKDSLQDLYAKGQTYGYAEAEWGPILAKCNGFDSGCIDCEISHSDPGEMIELKIPLEAFNDVQ